MGLRIHGGLMGCIGSRSGIGLRTYCSLLGWITAKEKKEYKEKGWAASSIKVLFSPKMDFEL
jgi:hypothetical protein